MEREQILTLLLVASASLIQTTNACNGYELKINSLKNCNSNSVLQMNGVTAELTKDCFIIPKGCVTITKTIKSAKGHYKITKSPMPPIEGDIDLCDAIEDDSIPEVSAMLSAYGVSNKCPVPGPRKVCPNGDNISMAKYKNHLGVAAGNLQLKLEINHDAGKTCIEMNMNIKKKK